MIAELPMYIAPTQVQQASEQWLALTLRLLGITTRVRDDEPLEQLWLNPRLLLSQTCGYPLMTRLKDQVRVVGRPCFDLPDAKAGEHCSLLVVNQQAPWQQLAELRGGRGVINSEDSNSGMNLLRHALAPLAQKGRFFSHLSISGSHRESLRRVAAGEADLAAIDSVTFAYLARYAPEVVHGVRVLGRTASSPTLPYITSAHGLPVEQLREAMNSALLQLPEVAHLLAIKAVLPAQLHDYAVLLGYQRQAAHLGFTQLD
ncbi:phosphate/phosphite/phosphonate ABC transporter substrate-binding protein [Pseudomonas abieticivorans]|uniref:phosphate/phosphite/phosphonate ABC transporter substrate-binding protein n=1 Tax=Pseudomonas abieticivorans TaxID=2931382 RepID=UPI0020BF1EDB|nr:PhnD/SsuA/transferrin family substrate-binding protein [Pseudomonas sp. PIA16]